MSMIPPIYRQPFGLPLNWRDEATGELKAAVTAFLQTTDFDLELLRAYLVHHINAPVWLENHPLVIEHGVSLGADYVAKIYALRATAPSIRNSIDAWAHISDCLDIGLDPL